MEKIRTETLICRTWKTKTIAVLLALAGAVALPQLFHLLGRVTDLGTSLGETFLPMHFTVFLVGLLAGPIAGALTGALAPVLSYALSGMPALTMLPFMTVELLGYGLIAGLLARRKMPAIVKLLLAQLGGRALRALALVLGVYAFGAKVNIATIWTSLLAGIPGLILQWLLIPLLMFYIENKTKKGEDA